MNAYKPNTELAGDMEREAKSLETTSDDRDWTMSETDALEAMRAAALRLTREIESIFDGLTGAPSPLSRH
jgi:phage host-nuclease inhibitor protein Gam